MLIRLHNLWLFPTAVIFHSYCCQIWLHGNVSSYVMSCVFNNLTSSLVKIKLHPTVLSREISTCAHSLENYASLFIFPQMESLTQIKTFPISSSSEQKGNKHLQLIYITLRFKYFTKNHFLVPLHCLILMLVFLQELLPMYLCWVSSP